MCECQAANILIVLLFCVVEVLDHDGEGDAHGGESGATRTAEGDYLFDFDPRYVFIFAHDHHRGSALADSKLEE